MMAAYQAVFAIESGKMALIHEIFSILHLAAWPYSMAPKNSGL
jgi:hypothetical protein